MKNKFNKNIKIKETWEEMLNGILETVKSVTLGYNSKIPSPDTAATKLTKIYLYYSLTS